MDNRITDIEVVLIVPMIIGTVGAFCIGIKMLKESKKAKKVKRNG